SRTHSSKQSTILFCPSNDIRNSASSRLSKKRFSTSTAGQIVLTSIQNLASLSSSPSYVSDRKGNSGKCFLYRSHSVCAITSLFVWPGLVQTSIPFPSWLTLALLCNSRRILSFLYTSLFLLYTLLTSSDRWDKGVSI